jgi:hypothetical protein
MTTKFRITALVDDELVKYIVYMCWSWSDQACDQESDFEAARDYFKKQFKKKKIQILNTEIVEAVAV